MTRPRITFCVTVVLVSAGVAAVRLWPPSATPDIEPPAGLLVGTTDHDFGPVKPEGGKLTHAFALVTRGPRPVELTVGRKGCGCVDVECPPAVEPGGTAKIILSVDPSAKVGGFSAPAEITTTDPANPLVRFVCRADSVLRAVVEPEMIDLFDVEGDAAIERTLTVVIRRDRGDGTDLPPMESNSPAVVCQREQAEEMADAAGPFRRTLYRHTVRIDPTVWRGQARGGSVDATLRAGDPAVPAVLVRAAFRHHPYLVGPTAVVLYRGRTEATTVRLWARDGRRFRLGKAESSLPGVTAAATGPAEARVRELAVAVDGTVLSTDARSGTVSVGIDGDADRPYRLDVLIRP